MKKTYRITIDYMIEINEKVKTPGDKEYNPELLEKIQHIMDAFFLSGDELFEFVKNRIYWGFLNSDMSENDLCELIELLNEDDFMPALSRHLPPETVPFLLGIYQCNSDFPGTIKENEDAIWLLLCQFGAFEPIRASIEEIVPYTLFDPDKKIN